MIMSQELNDNKSTPECVLATHLMLDYFIDVERFSAKTKNLCIVTAF